jgi:hypothetical protein
MESDGSWWRVRLMLKLIKRIVIEELYRIEIKSVSLTMVVSDSRLLNFHGVSFPKGHQVPSTSKGDFMVRQTIEQDIGLAEGDVIHISE